MRAVTYVLIASMALSGCAGANPNDPNLTPAQRELRQETERFNETVATGAILGCLLGAAIGAMAASHNRGAGAAIGCGAGGLTGGAAGYYVASQNERYASAESAINARIEAAQREAESYQSIADTSDQLKAQDLQKIAALKAKLAQGQITTNQYKDETKLIRQDIELLQKASSENNKVQGQIGQDMSVMHDRGMNTSELNQSQQRLQEAQQRIDSNAEAMVKALGVS